MDYKTYCDRLREAAGLAEGGDALGAIDVYAALVGADISDLDKCKLCCDIATLCEKLDQREQALAWFGEGIRYETPYSRCYALEMKAAFHANRHEDAEALELYERILPLPFLLESDKERIWRNITIIRNPRRP